MGGMLRFKDEKDFQELLKRSNVRIAPPRVVRPLDGPGPRVATPAAKTPNGPKNAKVVSEIEELFASQIALVGNLPAPVREYPFLRGRAHRLDFAWPEHRINGMQLGVEIQGMVHRVKGRFSADLEKRALGLLQDWLILEVGGDQVRSGKAMEWLQELFKRAVKT